jgi:hypothetical protein
VAKYQRISDADFRESGWDPAQFVEDEDQEGPFAVARLNNATCGCCGGGTTGYTVVNLSTAVGFSQDWTGDNGEVDAQEHAQFLNGAWLQGYSSHGTRGKPVDPTPDPLAEAKERVVEAVDKWRGNCWARETVFMINSDNGIKLVEAIDALRALRTPPDPVAELRAAWKSWNGGDGSMSNYSDLHRRMEDAIAAIEKARTP